MSLPPGWKSDPEKPHEYPLQRPTYAEVVAKLAEVTHALNMARMLMDYEPRKLTGEVVDEALDMLGRAREASR